MGRYNRDLVRYDARVEFQGCFSVVEGVGGVEWSVE